MTHEELLKLMDERKVWEDDWKFEPALRAVVELHKPSGSFCSVCGEELYPETYPCPTIQAIEKELQ
jgi:hypothetical protein